MSLCTAARMRCMESGVCWFGKCVQIVYISLEKGRQWSESVFGSWREETKGQMGGEGGLLLRFHNSQLDSQVECSNVLIFQTSQQHGWFDESLQTGCTCLCFCTQFVCLRTEMVLIKGIVGHLNLIRISVPLYDVIALIGSFFHLQLCRCGNGNIFLAYLIICNPSSGPAGSFHQSILSYYITPVCLMQW